MRILVIQETDWIERDPHPHHQMLEQLAFQGHQVVVVDYEILWHHKKGKGFLTPRQRFVNVSKVMPNADITVIRPAMLRFPGLSRLSWMVGNYLELRRLLVEWQPQVMATYSISNGFLALLLSRRHRIPLVFHVLDALHTLVSPRFLRPLAWLFERTVFQGARKVVVVSKGLRGYALSMGARPERVQVLPSGVNLEEFHPSVDGSGIRREHGLDEKDVVLLFLGHLYTFTGLREVVLELAKAIPQHPYLKLIIVGDGELYPELASLREELHLHKNLILTGRQPYHRMPSFVAASQVCVLPSHLNATSEHIAPVKVYDYLAGGRPVVATRLPGMVAEFGEDNGVVFVEGPAEVVSKSLELAGSVQSWNDLSGRARRFAEENGDWNKVTRQFYQILSQAGG